MNPPFMSGPVVPIRNERYIVSSVLFPLSHWSIQSMTFTALSSGGPVELYHTGWGVIFLVVQTAPGSVHLFSMDSELLSHSCTYQNMSQKWSSCQFICLHNNAHRNLEVEHKCF